MHFSHYYRNMRGCNSPVGYLSTHRHPNVVFIGTVILCGIYVVGRPTCPKADSFTSISQFNHSIWSSAMGERITPSYGYGPVGIRLSDAGAHSDVTSHNRSLSRKEHRRTTGQRGKQIICPYYGKSIETLTCVLQAKAFPISKTTLAEEHSNAAEVICSRRYSTYQYQHVQKSTSSRYQSKTGAQLSTVSVTVHNEFPVTAQTLSSLRIPGAYSVSFPTQVDSTLDMNHLLSTQSLISLSFGGAGLSLPLGVVVNYILIVYYWLWISLRKSQTQRSVSKHRRLFRFPRRMWMIAFATACSCFYEAKAGNIRSNILDGTSSVCIEYKQNVFYLTCDSQWTANNYISLSAYEEFDGNGHMIDLGATADFDGLFAIDTTVDSFAKAPTIRNVHTRSGSTSEGGGFIIQKAQQFFKVDSCSSSGKITGKETPDGENVHVTGGGGICGEDCGKDGGQISISNSFSSGTIEIGGGIVGSHVGNGGTVNITSCHSTGAIIGRDAGGISATFLGFNGGKAYIIQCYSSGNIEGEQAGGIIGGEGGKDSGYVYIKECYSIGDISGSKSGGITGDDSAQNSGKIDIIDCYSRGQVHGTEAGGICAGPVRGTLNIKNTYASGGVWTEDAGAIIGSIDYGADATVQYSVYDTNRGSLVGDESSIFNDVRNSGNINDITGMLYHYNGKQEWSKQVWALRGPYELPVLRFQLPTPSPTLSPAPSSTHTSSRTPSSSPTYTPTNSMTSSYTATPSETSTKTNTPTISRTPSGTATKTITPTATSTPSESSARSGTPTSTVTATGTSKPTSTSSETATLTKTSTPTITASHSSSSTATVTLTRTPTHTRTPSSSPTSSWTTTGTVTPSETMTASKSGTLTPTGSRTQSPSSSVTSTMSASVSSTSSRSPSGTQTPLATPLKESVSSAEAATNIFTSTLRTSLAAMLAVAVLLLAIYIGYRRRSNQTEAKRSNDPRSMYAKQLGIPVGSLKLMSTLDNSSSRSQHARMKQVQTHTMRGRDGFKVEMQQDLKSSTVKASNPLGETNLASINPLASTPQGARATRPQSDAARGTISAKFSLNYGKASKRTISNYAHSISPKRGNSAQHPAAADSVVSSSLEESSAPAVVLVDIKAQSANSPGLVRIVSTKSPSFQSGEKRSTKNVKHVAVAEDLNTAELRRLDRTRLRLRQWKARLLAEPSPLVEIRAGCRDGVSDTTDGEALDRRVSLDQMNAYAPSFGYPRRPSNYTTPKLGDNLSETKGHRPSGSRFKFSPQRSRRDVSAA